MDTKLKECPFCGSKNIDPEGWASATDSGPGCGDCGALADSVEKWNTRAAAPSAAAGSVDTPEFLRLCNAYYSASAPHHLGWRQQMVEWLNAWGAQHGAAEKLKVEQSVVLAVDQAHQRAEKAQGDAREAGNLAQIRLHRIGELEPKLFDALARVKALEAELAKVNAWYGTAHQIGEDLAARVMVAEERVEELEELGRGRAATVCDCHACQPITLKNNRMILCSTCGNKRCPHAGDHRNACTGSNEPGQAGSTYP